MKLTRRMCWIAVGGVLLGICGLAHSLRPRPALCIGATFSEVSDYIRSERARPKSSRPPFKRVRDQLTLLIIPGTLDSRGQVPDNVGKMDLVTDYGLRTNHVFATHVVEYYFGITNSIVGRVVRTTSEWKWNWDL